MAPQAQKKKRVLVVGAGCAGMSCAEQLSMHPDRFDVTLVEAENYCGGQAFSIPLDEEKYGAPWMNQGVQGGSYIYHHTMRFFSKYSDVQAQHVDLQVSFGKEGTFWTNLFPTKMQEKHASEIRRFKWAIRFMRWTEVFWALIPIKIALKMLFFSDDFMNFMIYPALALFLGTGNATPDLPSIMMERLYTSPTYGMWYEIDDKSLSSNLPPMVVFPEERAFYEKWRQALVARGVKVRLATEVDAITERTKERVKVLTRRRTPLADDHVPNEDGHPPEDQDQNAPRTEEEYDEIVLCVLADTAQRLLGKHARWIDNAVLGSTKWSDDITVTHNDTEYMKKWYQVDFDDKLAVSHINGRDDSDRVQRGSTDFNPMYLIKNVPADARKLEMCFDCSNFQYQLKEANKPFKDHVFQTIFLNQKHEDTWSRSEIRKDKIIREDWWHQLCHSYTHYIKVVPWMWLLNGKKSVTFGGSWTLVNAHELGVISGMAAAYTLGAEYPKELQEDPFALLCFRLYLLLSHGTIYRKGKNDATSAKNR